MSIGARRLVLTVMVVCSVLVGWLVGACASVFAATPQVPGSVVVERVGATKGTVRGVLNPGSEEQSGVYEFLYRESSAGSGCEGGFRAPEAPGMAFGLEGEEVSQELTALSPSTEYTVCLLERGLNQGKGEEAVSPPVKFKTNAVLEAPQSGVVTGITSSSARFQGMLNPAAAGEPGTYEFVYRQSSGECVRDNPETGQLEDEFVTPVEVALGHEKETVPALPVEVAELAPNRMYTVCLLARNEAGETALGSPVTFTTLSAKPSVSSLSVSLVQSNNATVNAQIDTGGLQTTYRVQYGPTSSYGLESASASLSEGAGSPTVNVLLDGLQPASEYHFRIVVENARGSATSSDGIFTTFPEATNGLPDGRVYEMVSPAEDYNANVFVSQAYTRKLPGGGVQNYDRPMQVAADGDAVAYLGEATTEGNGQSTSEYGNQYLATRGPEGGWAQKSIQPDGYASPSYLAFSNDLSQGILTTSRGGNAALPPLSPEELPIEYWDLFQHDTTGGAFEPLLPKSEVSLHRPPGGLSPALVPIYAGSSSDFSQSFFEANDALTSGTIDGGPEEYNLYDSVGGRLNIVNVLPSGVSEPNATFGQLVGGRSAFAASNEGAFPNESDFSHVVSADGSRVFWTDLNTTVDSEDPSGETRLFMRENPDAPQSQVRDGACTVVKDACTLQIDGGVGGGGRFWTASADGSRVFFTKGPLYEYDVEDGQTTDLSQGHDVEGVIGASEDGSYVYFVEEGEELYVSHDEQTPKLITSLVGATQAVRPYASTCGCGEVGDLQPMIGGRTAEVAANGSGVVFMSNQNLTGYEDEGLEEVYLYETEGGGRLSCVSCNASGEPPQRQVASGANSLYYGAAAFLPVSHEPSFMPRLISDDGARVFFDSAEPLVPKDTDGTQDVYEWERDGTGSCVQVAGCVYLLTGGNGAQNSWLLGADASGENVFIVSRSHLLEGGQGDEYALYDARVDGVLQVQPPACTGTGCQGVPEPPPVFATPPSVTYAGVGNFPPTVASPAQLRKRTLTRVQKLVRALKVCRRKVGRRRVTCEVQARRRYGARSRVRSSTAKGRK